jgi:hypothetical protein
MIAAMLPAGGRVHITAFSFNNRLESRLSTAVQLYL